MTKARGFTVEDLIRVSALVLMYWAGLGVVEPIPPLAKLLSILGALYAGYAAAKLGGKWLLIFLLVQLGIGVMVGLT